MSYENSKADKLKDALGAMMNSGKIGLTSKLKTKIKTKRMQKISQKSV